MLDAVLGLAKRVTVLAYRDYAEGTDGILDFSRSARVACFAGPIPHRRDPPAEKAGGSRQTFAEEGRVALEREAAVVSRQLTVNPFYLGVAVHDWHNWRRLA